MDTEDRAEKLKSRFEIFTHDQNVTDFKFALSFSFHPELYSETFETVPSIPLMKWSPENAAMPLELGKVYSFDIFEALRKKRLNLVALFPFENLTLQKEMAKFELPSTASRTSMPIFNGIDGTPPSTSIKYQGLFFKATISFRANNSSYTHYVTGRIAFGFSGEKSNSTKAMWVADFFNKPDYCSIRIGSDKAMALRIPQIVYNTQDLMDMARADSKNKFITISAADLAGNLFMECTWSEEVDGKWYYKKYINQLH